jgi:hypothetical protein
MFMSKYSELTEKFLKGELTLEELQAAAKSMSQDVEFQKLFEEYKTLLMRMAKQLDAKKQKER